MHHKTNKHLLNLEVWLNIVERKDHLDQPMTKRPKMVSFKMESIERAREAIYLHRQAARLKDDHLGHQSNHTSSLDQDSVNVNRDPIFSNNQVDIPNQIHLHNTMAFTRASAIIETTFPVLFQRDVMNLMNVLFFKKDSHSLKLHFINTFYEMEEPHRHWIAKKFDMRQQPNARL
jgi:hypothetical protein